MTISLLAVESSTGACSSAIYRGGRMEQRYRYVPQKQGELILTDIQSLLDSYSLTLAELDLLAYGCGPGSFTGVRIGASVMQGFAMATQLPVVAVSSLAAMAYGAYIHLGYTDLACAFDARMGEVYWGCYRFADGALILADEERVLSPEQVKLPAIAAQWVGVGDGWATYGEQLSLSTGIQRYYPRCYPQASGVAWLALGSCPQSRCQSVGTVLPHYVRDHVVHTRSK